MSLTGRQEVRSFNRKGRKEPLAKLAKKFKLRHYPGVKLVDILVDSRQTPHHKLKSRAEVQS